jgi:hypothetical protein
MLPYVVLKGAGVAIGRGKEALWAVGGGGGGGASAGSATAGAPRGTPRSLLAVGGDRQLTAALSRNLGFVEVADGRVSRLHCIISLRGGGAASAAGAAGGQQAAVLEDCSSNGTFLNGGKIGKGQSVPLAEGDRISLVLSVAPLVEQVGPPWEGRGGGVHDCAASSCAGHARQSPSAW